MAWGLGGVSARGLACECVASLLVGQHHDVMTALARGSVILPDCVLDSSKT